jgi:hypothetical protein
LPTHSHEDYQFCLSLDFPGKYRYRGSSYDVPVGSLSIIHPGETHSARDPEDRRKTANYRLMYVGPDLLRDAVGRARELLARGTPIARVAAETGFADHSHLTRTFKRLVQVPPSRYLPQNSKDVQDSATPSEILQRTRGNAGPPAPERRTFRRISLVYQKIAAGTRS